MTIVEEHEHEAARWFTRARRFPQLVGKTPDGKRIWGGPYTFTQIIGGVLVLGVGAMTLRWWGLFGFVGNIVVLLLATGGVVFGLGRVPFGARNPLSVTAGLLHVAFLPRGGTHRGRAFRLARPHLTATRCHVGPLYGYDVVERDLDEAPAAAALARLEPAGVPTPELVAEGPAVPPRPEVPAPALTHIQRMLAGATLQE